ncbi:REPLICATION FACTOR A 1, putative [Babesia bigemina]|uniref:REPLICATION FACTOR A 1, putative n=1 Tax=Babesia bigemina TaxID=5866 RepID=A0A061DAN8_BABBI|nr:REPLICATION FACTOR A 1, putative [Babesia bigemina]CDR97052.1 REPLICATION FACTOR A 1, putative [Babesia bigemina]|eukprot:XP_012769238.1 REPLICATION FACTOR A 1, putative [Babesia bigemina]
MELEYFPIKNLTTYTSNWTIKARILEKAPLRQIKGDNHLMHIDVVDKHGDSIRVKFWGKAATKWDEVLQKGKVYTFSKGTVELSNKRFNTTPHNYEITCHQESIIESVEDAGDIKLQRDHKLLTLRDIKTMPNVTQAPVDLLCIVNAVQPAANVTTKAGKEISKRVVMLVDDTGYEMELTLWAEHANNEAVEQMEGKAVIAEKVIIREWQGARSCQTLSSSEVQLATQDNIRDHTRLSQLQKWFEDAKAKNETFKTMRPQAVSARDQYELADMVTVADKTKGGYIVKGKLRKIFWKNKDGVAKMWYQACPMCTKKVIMDGDDNRYKCISCGDATVVPVPRYMFYCNFTDHTGRLTAQIATDIGEKLLGKTAKELEEMDPDKLKRFCDFEATHRDYKVSGYIKTRVYNGETKHNFTVTRVEPLDYAAEAALMLENMRITYDDVLKFLDIKTDERDSKKARV